MLGADSVAGELSQEAASDAGEALVVSMWWLCVVFFEESVV